MDEIVRRKGERQAENKNSLTVSTGTARGGDKSPKTACVAGHVIIVPTRIKSQDGSALDSLPRLQRFRFNVDVALKGTAAWRMKKNQLSRAKPGGTI